MLNSSRGLNPPLLEPSNGRCEICITGQGGQGIVLAGVILAKSAALYEGQNVVQTQSYGPESRGGASRCEIIISREAIDYPKAMRVDVLLALSQEALLAQWSRLTDAALVLADSVYVTSPPTPRPHYFPVPFTRMAIAETGNALAANMIALGTLVGLTGVVRRESVQSALAAQVKARYRESNLKALALGFQEADRLRGELQPS